MTLLEALTLIESAASPLALFGIGYPQPLYRKLARLCHPDTIQDANLKERSIKAFQKLGEFYTAVSPKGISLGKWDIGKGLMAGSLCDTYLAMRDREKGFLKIARNAKDNQFLDQEASVLRTLHADGNNFERYFPTLLDTFEASYRRTNVVSYAEDCLSLTYLKAQFPGGLDFRHIVWMMNRLLSALEYAHCKDIIHGAILPQHLLYRPGDHGLILVDWTASVPFPSDGHIPYRVKQWEGHYPIEVSKKDCYKATDIFMAAKAMLYAASSVPNRFRSIFDWMTAESPSARPDDAWALHTIWKGLAEEEYGKPKFVELKVPVN